MVWFGIGIDVFFVDSLVLFVELFIFIMFCFSFFLFVLVIRLRGKMLLFFIVFEIYVIVIEFKVVV